MIVENGVFDDPAPNGVLLPPAKTDDLVWNLPRECQVRSVVLSIDTRVELVVEQLRQGLPPVCVLENPLVEGLCNLPLLVVRGIRFGLVEVPVAVRICVVDRNPRTVQHGRQQIRESNPLRSPRHRSGCRIEIPGDLEDVGQFGVGHSRLAAQQLAGELCVDGGRYPVRPDARTHFVRRPWFRLYGFERRDICGQAGLFRRLQLATDIAGQIGIALDHIEPLLGINERQRRVAAGQFRSGFVLRDSAQLGNALQADAAGFRHGNSQGIYRVFGMVCSNRRNGHRTRQDGRLAGFGRAGFHAGRLGLGRGHFLLEAGFE